MLAYIFEREREILLLKLIFFFKFFLHEYKV